MPEMHEFEDESKRLRQIADQIGALERKRIQFNAKIDEQIATLRKEQSEINRNRTEKAIRAFVHKREDEACKKGS